MRGSCKDSKMHSMLHAYELGMLSGGEKDEFEAHLLECEFCFAHIKEFMPRGAILVASPEIKRLLGSVVGERQSTESRRRKIWELIWPQRLPVLLRPAILIGLLVLIIYPAYVGIFDRPGDKVTSVAEIGLWQARSKMAYAVEEGDAVVLSFVCPDGESIRGYSVVLTNPLGKVIYADEEFQGVDKYRVGRLLLPRKVVSPGEYILVVRSLGDVQGNLSSLEYSFEIQLPDTK